MNTIFLRMGWVKGINPLNLKIAPWFYLAINSYSICLITVRVKQILATWNTQRN